MLVILSRDAGPLRAAPRCRLGKLARIFASAGDPCSGDGCLMAQIALA